MSRAPTDLPERLLAADATDFERRVIEAALQKKPSPAAAARMASALGVTMSSAGTAAGAKTPAAEAAASKATVGAGASTAWPWVSLGVLGLVVGAVVGARAWHASRPQPAPASPALIAPPPRQTRLAGAIARRRGRGADAQPGRPRSTAATSRRPRETFGTRLPFWTGHERPCRSGTVVARWRSCAGTVTNTRPGASVPKPPPSGLRP